MARRTYEEYTTVWWVPTIADHNAPTVAEITAGTDISAFLPKDGVKVGFKNDTVDNNDITSAFNPQIPGSYSASASFTFFRDDTADTAWDLFKTRNTYGHVVVRRMVPVTQVVADGDLVEVYPVATGSPVVEDSAENERVKFVVDFAVHQTPVTEATVGGVASV
jgi:hypothetical protein